MIDNSVDTVTFRNNSDQTALPIRRWGAFLPGEGVGGTTNHWGGLHWRFLPTDFRIRSEITRALRRESNSGGHDHRRTGRSPMTNSSPISTSSTSSAAFRARPEICGDRRSTAATSSKARAQNEYPNRAAESLGRRACCSRKRRKSVGFHPFPTPFSAPSQALYQHLWRDARAVRILRLLRAQFLRGQRQGDFGDQRHAGAAQRSEIHAEDPRLRQTDQLRQAGEESHRRHLHRHEDRRGIRAAGRHGDPVGLRLRQHAYDALFGHRRTLRPQDRQGSSSARTIAISSKPMARRSSRTRCSIPSWARRATAWPSTISMARISTIRAWASSAAATSSAAAAPRRRSAGARCRKASPTWGAEWKQADRQMVLRRRRLQHAGLGLRQSRELSRSRSDL